MTSPTLKHILSSGEPSYGIWVASGNSVNAEICASAGFDWLVIDTEHAPNDLRSVVAQLQAVYGYPVAPVVRPAVADTGCSSSTSTPASPASWYR